MALGNTHGSSSHLKDMETTYKIAFVMHDTKTMKMTLDSLDRAHYAESTKTAAKRRLVKWEKEQ